MHTARFLRIVIITCIASLLFSGCASSEMKKIRAMPISHVNLENVRDGTWTGVFSYGQYTYKVQITVRSNSITDLKVIQNRTTKHAKAAEEIVNRILTEQKNDVDAVSGATTTSKALLKATEIALKKGLPD